MKTNNRNIFLPIIAVALFSHFSISSFAQNTFESIFQLVNEPHRAVCLVEGSDKSFIVAGDINSGTQAPVCKVDSSGILIWDKFISQGFGAFTDVVCLSSGNLLVAGYNWLETGVEESSLTKLTSNGDSVWMKKFVYGTQTKFTKMVYTSNHDIALSCEVLLAGSNRKIMLISADTAGLVQWEANVIENDTNNLYFFNSLIQLPDSSFFLAGGYKYSVFKNKPLMARVSSAGELLYTRVHELPWPEGSASVYGVCPDGKGNVMSCARFYPTSGGSSGIWMIKTNPSGDTLWTKTIAGEGPLYYPKAVTLCSDGGFAVAGRCFSNQMPDPFVDRAFIMRLDSLANVLWVKTYSPDKRGFLYDITETPDRGFAATGCLSMNSLDYGIYLVKTDTAGLITSTWQPGAVADRLTVSPNPVADVCRVTLPEGCRQLTLLTLQGQTLSTFNTTGKSTLELSTNWLPAGLYLLRAETSTMRTTEKIVKYAR
jgi:hypothetical protein